MIIIEKKIQSRIQSILIIILMDDFGQIFTDWQTHKMPQNVETYPNTLTLAKLGIV